MYRLCIRAPDQSGGGAGVILSGGWKFDGVGPDTSVDICGDPVRVNLWFMQTQSKWPLIITIESRGYLHTNTAVISGNEIRYPASNAWQSVDSSG